MAGAGRPRTGTCLRRIVGVTSSRLPRTMAHADGSLAPAASASEHPPPGCDCPPRRSLGNWPTWAAEGVHERDRMPFIVPWTDLPPAERARSVVQHHWLRRGNWATDNWALHLCVFEDGRVVGLQTIAAHDFAVLRQVSTASWLGVHHQRQGIGTEMRAAVLHLAFAGLGARPTRCRAPSRTTVPPSPCLRSLATNPTVSSSSTSVNGA